MPKSPGTQRNKKTGKGQITIPIQLNIKVHDQLEEIQEITKKYGKPTKAGILTELVDREYKRLKE